MTYGPNQAGEISARLPANHRCEDSRWVVRQAEARVLDALGLDAEGWRALFVSGSATTALEAVAVSLHQPCLVLNPHLTFGGRWRGLLEHHGVASPTGPLTAAVVYETDAMHYLGAHWDQADIVDMVSAAPFYPVPLHAQVVVTTSGKQFGCPPGLGIVCVRNDAWGWVLRKEECGSSLCLARHLRFAEQHETPYTPNLAALCALSGTFWGSETRSRMQRRRELLEDALGQVEGCGPAVRIPCDRIHSLEIASSLWPLGEDYQAFTWAGTNKEWAALAAEVRKGCGA